MNDARDAAISQQVVWRSPALRDYAVALLGAWMELYSNGVRVFGASDVPEDQQPGGGIPGNVHHLLSRAEVISPAWIPGVEGQILRRMSKRPKRKDAAENCYRLHYEMAAEWLRRNDPGYRDGQQEMAI